MSSDTEQENFERLNDQQRLQQPEQQDVEQNPSLPENGFKSTLSTTKRTVIPLRIANMTGWVVVIIFNIMSSQHVFRYTNAEIADKYDLIINPAGYAFSIWGLIFALEALFCIYQLFPFTYNNETINRNISIPWLLNCLFTTCWVISFNSNVLWLSTIFMFGILFTLIAIYSQINIYANPLLSKIPGDWGINHQNLRQEEEQAYFHVNDSAERKKMFITRLGEFWCINAGFNLHTAWISVATILNVGIMLKGDLKWEGQPASPLFWGIILLLLIPCLGGAIAFIYAEPLFPGVLAWALFAIAGSSYEGSVPTGRLVVAIICGIVCTAMCMVCSVYRIYRVTQRWKQIKA
eukprot:gb/GECH01000914.1/.p1 GENE.gb/GECH01000914.1/~~gb/GECH01000914.1/.p1  ORF type:complete len:349 (+),score=56.62 gb/GECH01000914.1/:1-1047(+)